MPHVDADALELARLLGILYTEVFQRTVKEENKPLSKSSHKQDRMTLKEDTFTVLVPSLTETLWGQSGISHHVSENFSTPLLISGTANHFKISSTTDVLLIGRSTIQGVWGEGGTWS